MSEALNESRQSALCGTEWLVDLSSLPVTRDLPFYSGLKAWRDGMETYQMSPSWMTWPRSGAWVDAKASFILTLCSHDILGMAFRTDSLLSFWS